jgi:hypothetical protein
MLNYKTATNEELKIEFKRLSKRVGDMPLGTRKEFYHLPAILEDGETPMAVASGLMGGNTWLITLTNQRIIFLDKGMVSGLKQVVIDLRDILSANGKTRMKTGSITLCADNETYTIENMMKGAVLPLTDLINRLREQREKIVAKPLAMPAQNASALTDMISQLEKLASLKERGILSDEEFSMQKAKILAMS